MDMKASRVHGRADQRRERRRLTSASATFYKWKAKYGGLEVSDEATEDARDENAKLKKLLAEAMLDKAMLKDIASKKW